MKPGNALRRRRQEMNLTPEQAAKKIGIAVNVLLAQEQGGMKNPRPPIVAGYAKLYGLTTDEVVRALMK